MVSWWVYLLYIRMARVEFGGIRRRRSNTRTYSVALRGAVSRGRRRGHSLTIGGVPLDAISEEEVYPPKNRIFAALPNSTSTSSQIATIPEDDPNHSISSRHIAMTPKNCVRSFCSRRSILARYAAQTLYPQTRLSHRRNLSSPTSRGCSNPRNRKLYDISTIPFRLPFRVSNRSLPSSTPHPNYLHATHIFLLYLPFICLQLCSHDVCMTTQFFSGFPSFPSSMTL